MSSSARRYLAGSWRTLCSAFTLDPNAEKFAFARFRNDDSDEFPPEPDSGGGKQRRRTLHIGGADTELADIRKMAACGGDGVTVPIDGSSHLTNRGSKGGEDGTTKDGPGNNGHWTMIEGGQEGSNQASSDNRNRISSWQAGWNVTNAIQGMFIVTFPYTVYQGGYWALVSMAVVAIVCCYTGKILIDCLYEDSVNPSSVTTPPAATPPGDCTGAESRSKVPSIDRPPTSPAGDTGASSFRSGQIRIRDSYVAIAEVVWGRQVGGRLVFVAQLIELLMTCILYVLLCGDLLLGVFPDLPLNLAAWTMVSAAALLPCAFLRSLRHVAWLSFWCTVAHMVINGIIIVYCFTRVTEWHWDAVQIRIDIRTFPIALGIVIFSYTSQIFLPSLEANLIDRRQFAPMMHWTHVAAAVFKVAFSYIGFVTFGFDTEEVITNNLPSQLMKVVVNMFLVAKALLSYPLPYFAAAELIETAFFRGRPETLFPPCYERPASTSMSSGDGAAPAIGGALKLWALALRLGLVVVTMLMAIFVPHFAILMGLIGSVTGNMLSLVWPAYFHLRIKGATIGWWRRSIDVVIVLLGLTCCGLGLYFSSHALIAAFQGRKTTPFQRH